MSSHKPTVPMILGSGALADAMRRMVDSDPDRYRPVTISTRPVGRCPCCGEDIYRITSRHTNWVEAFAPASFASSNPERPQAGSVHPRFSKARQPDPHGPIAGCCCVAPDWGPKHKEETKKKPKGKKVSG